MASVRNIKIDAMTTEGALYTGVTHMSYFSDNDGDKTSERLPGINVHDNLSRSFTEENHITEKQPASSGDEEIPDKTSASSSKRKNRTLDDVISKLSSRLPTPPSYSNIEDTLCMSTHDSSSFSDDITDIPDSQSSGCSSDFINEQPANDLGADKSSETHPSGCPSVIEPESPFCSPLEEDGNKTEVSTSVSDVSQENMENDVSASQTFNREILPVASSSNGGTLQNEKEGPNKGTISNVVSPEQITALSRKLVMGNLCEWFKKIVPQIKNSINSAKRNTTKDAEQGRDDEAISEESTNPNTPDQPESAGNDLHEPLENQESSDESIKQKDPGCQERNESITPKRKRSEDSEELLPNLTPQLTEGNLSEKLEIPNFRENATPGSVESERASERQSGPSRMTPVIRRRLFRPIHRNKRRSGFRRERVGHVNGIDGFGRAVAGQCRLIAQDRQVKYMSFVLAAADLFHAPTTLPDIDHLLANLRTALEGSQQPSPWSDTGASENLGIPL